MTELKQVNEVQVGATHPRKGLALSLLSIPVGVILWVVIWKFGFIASIASFVIAWLAIYLYKRGSGGAVSRTVLPYLLVVIAVGVILSFVAGMASDAVDYYNQTNSVNAIQALTSGAFWSFFADNLLNNGELWGSYVGDIVMSLVFAAIGLYGIVRDLFVTKKPVVETKA